MSADRESSWTRQLALCALLGLGLRLLAIAYLVPWHDELYSLDIARLGFGDFLSFAASGADYHPPGFYFGLQLLRMASGGACAELSYRIANLLWFLLLIAALALYARRVRETRKHLVLVALVIALSPSFVYHGAELRMYAMLLASATAALLCAHLAATRSGYRYFVAFGLVSLLGCLTHYASALVSLSLGLAILVFGRASRRVLLGCALSAALVLLGLVPFLGMLIEHLQKNPAYAVPWPRSLMYIAMALSVPLLVVLVWLRAMPSRASTPAGRHDSELGGECGATLWLFAKWAGLAFLLLAALVSALRGPNLINAGVALIPASWLIIALSPALASLSRHRLRAALAFLVIGNLLLCARLIHDPATLAGKRLSTLTKFERFLDAHPGWAASLDRALIHIDWPRDNQYFEDQLGGAFAPGALAFFSPSQSSRVPLRVEAMFAEGREEVLLLSRTRLADSVQGSLARAYRLQTLGAGVLLIGRAP